MEAAISIARACRIMDIQQYFFYYQSTKDDSEVESAIRLYARDGEGFDKMLQRMNRMNIHGVAIMCARVYLNLHFNIRVRLKRRIPTRVKTPLEPTDGPNLMWSMDFVSDVCVQPQVQCAEHNR